MEDKRVTTLINDATQHSTATHSPFPVRLYPLLKVEEKKNPAPKHNPHPTLLPICYPEPLSHPDATPGVRFKSINSAFILAAVFSSSLILSTYVNS